MIDLNNASLWDITSIVLVGVIVVGIMYFFVGNKSNHFGQSDGDLVNNKFVQVPFNVDAFDAINAGWLMPNEDRGQLTVAITNRGRRALEQGEKMLPSLRKFMNLLLEEPPCNVHG